MKITIVLAINIISTIIAVKKAHAYIDPGTGSMVIQALLAILATVSVSIGIFWKHIRSFFSRLLGRNKNE